VFDGAHTMPDWTISNMMLMTRLFINCYLYQEVKLPGFRALAPNESCGIVPLRSALRPVARPISPTMSTLWLGLLGLFMQP
jgi:hypothetical protein